MRVKFVQGVAGHGWSFRPREVCDLPDLIARQYIASGAAVPADVEPEEEAAVLESEASGPMLARPRGRHRGDLEAR